MPRVELPAGQTPRARTRGYDSPVQPDDHRQQRTARFRRAWRALLWSLLVLALLATVVPRVTMWVLARGDVAHRASDVPSLPTDEHRAAIVLGAGLKDRRPSPLLDDRITAAVRLLKDQRVDLLVMSGDNTTQYYDEPTAMRRRAIELGAPADQVAADYAGRRTWDTCVRAHDVFGIRRAVVVTNAFHIDRSVASCRAAGIDVQGFSVDDGRFPREQRFSWRAREVAASGRALLDAWVLKPAPAVGGEPIDPYDPCELRASLAPSDAESNGQGASAGC